MRGSLLDTFLGDGELVAFPTDPAQQRIAEAWTHQGKSIEEAINISKWGFMPVAGGADAGVMTVQNVPVGIGVKYDPNTFFQRTEGKFFQRKNFAVNPG